MYTEKTLQRYSIAALQELCVKNGIEVDNGSRRLKKPYINALLLNQVRQKPTVAYHCN
jgi:hypothetical protein